MVLDTVMFAVTPRATGEKSGVWVLDADTYKPGTTEALGEIIKKNPEYYLHTKTGLNQIAASVIGIGKIPSLSTLRLTV